MVCLLCQLFLLMMRFVINLGYISSYPFFRACSPPGVMAAAFWFCNNPATAGWPNGVVRLKIDYYSTSCVRSQGFKYKRPTECLAGAHFNVFWWDLLLFMASLYSDSIPDCGSHSPLQWIEYGQLTCCIHVHYYWNHIVGVPSAGSVGGFGFVSEQWEEPYSWWWWDQLIEPPLWDRTLN